MTEHDDSTSGRSATVEPDQTDQNRKKFSKLLGTDLYDESSDHEQSRIESTPGESAAENVSNQAHDPDESKKQAYALQRKKVLIIAAGIAIPLLVLICWSMSCSDRMIMLLLKHPIETLIEIAAVINIPLGNYLISRATERGDLRHPRRNGIIIGLAAGTALLIALGSSIAVSLGYPVTTADGDNFAPLFSLISLAGFLSCAASIILAIDLRNMREFRSARKISMLFSLGGVFAAILLLIGAEAKPTVIRMAEANVSSDVASERDAALSLLHNLGAERDLMMESADPRAAGISGMFIKMDPVMQRQAYFMLTGKPFRDRKASDFSAMPDDYLRRHLVGAPVENLALARSAMTGTVNGDNLTSGINWTFVLKNRNYNSREARAEIVLPHGAVVNGVTQWAGEGSPPLSAHVGRASEQTFASFTSHNGADVTDLGHDRILIRCPNVPAQSETKVMVSIATPLTLNNLKSASLTLPRFADSNFNVLADNTFRLRSDRPLHFEEKGFSINRNADGDFFIAGSMKGDELSERNLTLDVDRDPEKTSVISAFDSRSKKYYTRTVVASQADIPKSLMIVVDGSLGLQKSAKDIADALKNLPQTISSSVMIASTDPTFKTEPLSLKDGITKIESSASLFSGGQDNLQAVVKAAGIAGESKNGAVLWIHGPQAGLNKELYITEPYNSTPRFFEISVEKGANDAAELFRNHREIGPFQTITRTDNIKADLKHFINNWQSGASNYDQRYTVSLKASNEATPVKPTDLAQFLSVCQKKEYDAQLERGDSGRAERLAYLANIVTPHTPAVISYTAPNAHRETGDATYTAAAEFKAQTNGGTMNSAAPSLTGETNGTIGAQAADATYVTGVNTAGTVRVNNLANLEAMLNLISNSVELLGIIAGTIVMLTSVLSGESAAFLGFKLTRRQAFALGAVMFIVGLAVPGTINWLVCSARDANLFD